MSILIKGMEMPHSCWECPFEKCVLRALVDRHPSCPLVEMPPNTAFIDKGDLYREIAEQRDLAIEYCAGVSTANPLVLKYIATANVWAKVAEIVADAPAFIETEGEK